MSIYYWNCASGLVRKWETIRDIVLGESPLVFFVAEADVKFGMDLSFLNINGYRLALNSTFASMGKCRLICFYKESVKRLCHLEEDGNELMVFSANNQIIVGTYRPFKCFDGETISSNFNRLIDNLSHVVKQCSSHKSLVHIVGDLNIDMNNENSPFFRKFQDWLDNFALAQIVKNDTRSRMVSGKLQRSLLDVFITSSSDFKVELDFNSYSDHCILKGYKEKVKSSTNKERVIYYDWRRYSDSRLRELLSMKMISIDLSIEDPDHINDKLVSAITECLNVLVPKRISTIRGSNAVVNPLIQNLKNRKIRAYKLWGKTKDPKHWVSVKELSKKLNREIKIERNRVLSSQLNKDTKSFWSSVNSLMGRNVRNNSVFNINDEKVSNPQVICESFANYFKDKVNSLTKNISLPTFELGSLGVSHSDIKLFSDTEILKAIDSLKPKRSFGFDEIPNKVLKDCKTVIIKCLVGLFNITLSTGKLPRSWKISKITPVHKKGKVDDISNYRPVSLTSSLSKVFEKCILLRLDALDQDTLNGKSQHGFRPHCSTITATLSIQEYIANELDKDNAVFLYSADLTAAFDLLRPSFLMTTLTKIGIDNYISRIIWDFLSDRTGYVCYNGNNSCMFDIPIGCVQGSVLGPRLFNIYMNDLEMSFPSDIFFTSYADDSYVGISCQITELDKTLSKLESIMETHFEILEKRGMVINRSKTEIVVFNRWGDLQFDFPKIGIS